MQFSGLRYYGSKSSPLCHFYRACYRVFLGFEQGMKLEDALPVNHTGNRVFSILQDVFAPFFIFNRAGYQLDYSHISQQLKTEKIMLEAKIVHGIGRYALWTKRYELEFGQDRLQQINVLTRSGKEVLSCRPY
jgi:hypothetical protein